MSIKTEKDLKFYIEADRIISGRNKRSSLKSKIYNIMFPDYLEQFMVTLRTCEYYNNRERNIKANILYLFSKNVSTISR